MAKPILYSVNAFDADKDYDFLFTWSGLQSIGSSLQIIGVGDDNDFGETFYYSSYILEHTLPSGSLENGKTYQAKLRVSYIDSNGVATDSEQATPMQFECFSTPTLEISNLNSGAVSVINTASFDANIEYTTEYSNNILERYKVTVYLDGDCTQVYRETDITYTKGDLSALSAYIGGLNNERTYYIVVTGVTNWGMEFESEIYEISVSYDSDISAAFTATVENGHIRLDIAQRVVDGYWNGTPNYWNQQAIVGYGDSIIFNSNWEISDDFTIILKLSDMLFDNKQPFITIYEKGTDNKVELYVATEMSITDEVIATTEYTVRIALIDYVTGRMYYSDSFTGTADEDDVENSHTYLSGSYTLIIKRQNGRYYLTIEPIE